MFKIIFIITFLFVGAFTVSAQCPVMPEGFICLSREAAQKALEAGDRADALSVQLDAQKAAYEQMRTALNDMRVSFATVSGENTILKQQQVADRALMTVLVQNTKKKRFGLINIF